MSCRKLFRYIEEDQCFEVDKFLDTDNEDKYDFTSFRDFDWFSSSGHSWEEDISERYSIAYQAWYTFKLSLIIVEQFYS